MKIEKTFYGGIEFDKFISEQDATAVSCIGDERIIIKGKPKISICQNQIKFGTEVEISLIAHKDHEFKKEVRNKSDWNVVEIYMPIDEAKEILKATLKKLEEIEK